jgi:glycosyltransferase involved in cell wall biosynthesis
MIDICIPANQNAIPQMPDEKRKIRIVMAVHNSATNDHRVVKSAEAVQKAGYDCHVVGTLKEPFLPHEVINNVSYHRIRLTDMVSCLFLGFFPGIVPKLRKMSSRTPKKNENNRSFISSVLSHLVRVVSHLFGVISSVIGLVLTGVISSLVLFFIGISLVIISVFVFLFHIVSAVISIPKRIATISIERTANPTPKTLPGIVATMTNISPNVPKIGKALLNRMRKIANASPFVPWYIRGRYLHSFYPKLVDLNADAYHCHEMWLLQSCVLAARENGAKVVYDSHELEAHRNAPWSAFVRKQWVRYERKYIKYADRVITVSDGCADELQRAYDLPEVTIVRNTPMYEQSGSDENVRTSLGLSDQTPLVVYVGAVTFNRGVENVLAAMRNLPGYAFVTVGPWRQDIRQKLLDYASCHGLEDRFFMHEKVPHTQIVDFISSADISVSPIQNACLSYYCCLPSKLFESAFAGLPIVASDFPDMRRFILDNEIGVVCDETDPASIAESIKKAYESRHTFYTPDKIGRIREKHCFEEEGKKISGIYDDLFGFVKENGQNKTPSILR